MSKSETTQAHVGALVEAVWQVLDDMGTDRTSCCLYAKAKLRAAFQPWVSDDLPMGMPLADADAIIRETDG
jgi:hypothetical protein